MKWSIRPGRQDDIAAMQRVEVEAGERFRDISLDSIADDEPPGTPELAEHVRNGSAWVAVAHKPAAESVVGYATASQVDGEGHLDQVSVSTSAAGQGIGLALICEVHEWAKAQGFTEVTLTTFAEVPWNGPYYERLGYAPMSETALGPELAAIREQERQTGLDVTPRLAMRCPLDK
jgi:ribosomal protein S18 acetylase RimI-like enzyme